MLSYFMIIIDIFLINPMMGKINAGKLIATFIPFVILTPLYCYYLAVKLKQEKPFPAATIKLVACHYP